MTARVLVPRAATIEALSPYGSLVGPGAGATGNASPFYDGAVTTSRPVEFRSDEDTAVSLCHVQPRRFDVAFLERHYKHTQMFVPLGGKPFIAVLGAPTDGEEPDYDALEAFRFDGRDAFCMHIGTWHELPFALESDTHLIVVLRNETNRDLTNIEGGEASGPDLSKISVRARTGGTIAVAVE